MIDITPIAEAIISLVAVVITAFVVPYVKSRISQAQFDELCIWAKIAVDAAEQIYRGSGRGEEKKAYVIKFLNEKGFKLDTDSLDALIEAYVKDINDEKKEA